MKRKYQLIIIIAVGFAISLLLYFRLNKQNNTILFLGDSLLKNPIYESNVINKLPSYPINKDYLIDNITTSQLYQLINNNPPVNDNKPQKDIHDAKIIIISVGYQELESLGNIRMYLYELERIIVKLKKLNNNTIYLVSMPESNEKYQNINYWLRNLASKYKIEYLTLQ